MCLISSLSDGTGFFKLSEALSLSRSGSGFAHLLIFMLLPNLRDILYFLCLYLKCVYSYDLQL